MSSSNGKRTNADLRKLEEGLAFLSNQAKEPKVKWPAYNGFQYRIHRLQQSYKPLFEALRSVEQKMIEDYEKEAGDDVKELADGRLHFGPLDRQFMRDHDELMALPVLGDEPKVSAFALADFDAAGVSVPAVVLARLGKHFGPPDSVADGSDNDDDA